MEKLLNVKEAAEFLNVAEMTVRRWTNGGKLRCFRVGGKRERRFRVQDLHAYVEGRAVSPSPRAVPLGIPGLTVPDGSHVTHLSLNAQESVDVGASYLLEGIANEESVLLVAPDAAAEHILSAVRGRGGDVAALRKKGRLVLSRGAKKPETMATFISQAAMKARGRFRLFGDMSWAQKAGWSLERLHALENITNASLGRSGKLYLCQYPLWLCSGRVAQLARQADVERGAFYIALSGGSLLEILCPGLVSIPLRDEIYWASWHVFWADERCVPPSSPDSNFAAAERRLFRHVGIPRSQIHAMNAAFGPDDGARDYESLMAEAFAPIAGRLPRFDLILLGIGEDGHTASLFPRHALLSETRRWVAPVFDAPKPPPERMTVTLPVINNARHVVFVAAGESKAPALAAVINPDRNDALLPAGQVDPTEGVVQWFVDDDAARGLPRAGVSTEARS